MEIMLYTVQYWVKYMPIPLQYDFRVTISVRFKVMFSMAYTSFQF